MKIAELLNEAISISHLEEPIKRAIKDGIKSAVGELYDLKNQYPDLEDEFDQGHSSAFRKTIVDTLMNKYANASLAKHISQRVRPMLNKELGDEEVKQLEFFDLDDNVGGQAAGAYIDINQKSLKTIANQVTENLLSMVFDNYGEGELAGGLWFIVNSLKRGERDYAYNLLDNGHMSETIEDMASTIVHEVVHVIQHNTQDKKGFGHHEYRSYLDKKKGEFVDLHNKKYSDISQLSADDESKYFKLYMASPQEMTAFSHQLAIKMANDYSLPQSDTLEDLEHNAKNIDAEGIIEYVNQKVGRYFRAPDNKREYAVFKRYVKQVYQELQAYIAKRREYLSKTLDESSKYLDAKDVVKINKKGWQIPLNKKGFGV